MGIDTADNQRTATGARRPPEERAQVSGAIPVRPSIDQLFTDHFDAVFSRAYAWLRDREAAKDASSAVFLKALRKLDTFHGGSARAWLLTITDNHLKDIAKSPHQETPMLEGDDWQSGAPAPEEVAVFADDLERFSRALATLSAEDREVVVLRAKGYRLEEIAQELGRGLTANAIAQKHGRAMTKLKAAMDGPAGPKGGPR